MEASVTLDCSIYSENIVDVLKAFQQIGWGMYYPQGKIAYLPIGDGAISIGSRKKCQKPGLCLEDLVKRNSGKYQRQLNR